MPKEGAPFIMLSNLDTLAPVRALVLWGVGYVGHDGVHCRGVCRG